jgi:hypothetical protein
MKFQFSLGSMFFLFLGFALGFGSQTWLARQADWLEGEIAGRRYCENCKRTFRGYTYGKPPIMYQDYAERYWFNVHVKGKWCGGTQTPFCKKCWKEISAEEKIAGLKKKWAQEDEAEMVHFSNESKFRQNVVESILEKQ